jgi:hypothetical protein
VVPIARTGIVRSFSWKSCRVIGGSCLASSRYAINGSKGSLCQGFLTRWECVPLDMSSWDWAQYLPVYGLIDGW